MAFKKPPRHRADATPTYVDIADPDGVDWERVGKETEQAKKRNEEKRKAAEDAGGEPDKSTLEDIDEHPVTRYFAGKTRLDISAPDTWAGETVCFEDYLKPDAWKFVLRRLDWAQYYDVRNAQSSEHACLEACKLCLVRIEGPGAPELEGAADGCLTYDDMQTIHEMGAGLPIRLGSAAIQASRPLTSSEKKSPAPRVGQ